MDTANIDTETEPTSGARAGTFHRYRQRYQGWFAAQPHEHLATTMVLGAVVAFGLYWALRLLGWILGGLVDWLFLADAPPPPPSPDGPPSPLGIATQGTGEYVAEIVHHWSIGHAFGHVDPAMVPVLWLLVGLVLLLFTRTLPGVAMFVGWSAATVWVIYAATPGGNPVPAALVAGSIALGWCCWWLVSGFVAALMRT